MPLSPQTIENALVFLGRASLTGAEVPAFVEVTNALQEHRMVLQAQAAQPQEQLPEE